jgi:transcriptional regulator with XRE-family HTH domain
MTREKVAMRNEGPRGGGKRQGLSQRQYAKHLGLSRGAVLKMLASDRLVLFPDGSIDAEASDLRRTETTVTMKRTTSPSERPNAVTYATARAEREALKTELRRLELQRRRGELVDRQRAVAIVFRLARQERDAWLT